MSAVTAVLLVVALVPAPAVLLLAAEIALSLRAGGRRRPDAGPPPPFTVLVPAHNEAAVLETTLASLTAQLRAGDRLLVVADNCSDDTAALARACDAEVTERQDDTRRGKGYALDWGMRHDAVRATAVTVIVDSDCLAGDGALPRLAAAAARDNRPVQADYRLVAPPGAGVGTRFSAFAVRVKNVARLRGAQRLGLPCLLTGSGMAFPRDLLERASLGSGEIVEDLLLAVDLALEGAPASFCAGARITSPLPLDQAAADGQRTRWEGGYLSVARRFVPRLGLAGLRGRPALLGMALDIAIPPLSLFAVALVALAAAMLVAALLGAGTLPLIVAGLQIALFVTTVVAAWMAGGRDLLSPGEVAALPLRVLWKLPFYLRLASRPATGWVRTARDAEREEQ